MTYRLNPEIRLVESPILIHFPDGAEKRFSNGNAVINATFNKPYLVKNISALRDEIVIVVEEQGQNDALSYFD